MLDFLKRITLLIVGSVLLIGGCFVAIAGAVSGFGSSGIGIKIAYAVGGICLVVAGIYCYYFGSNKNLSKVIADIINALVGSI